jgi:hypothetical protein
LTVLTNRAGVKKTKIVAPDRGAQPTWSWPTHLVSRNMVSDIPFALPTIVAGLVLLSLYGPSSLLGVNWANTRVAVFLAFLFVTLPFIVRTRSAGTPGTRAGGREGGGLDLSPRFGPATYVQLASEGARARSAGLPSAIASR